MSYAIWKLAVAVANTAIGGGDLTHLFSGLGDIGVKSLKLDEIKDDDPGDENIVALLVESTEREFDRFLESEGLDDAERKAVFERGRAVLVSEIPERIWDRSIIESLAHNSSRDVDFVAGQILGLLTLKPEERQSPVGRFCFSVVRRVIELALENSRFDKYISSSRHDIIANKLDDLQETIQLHVRKTSENAPSRELLENLAWRFEFKNPDASMEEISRFLKEKAKEWSELKLAIEELRSGSTTLVQNLEQAEKLLTQGNFQLAHITLENSRRRADDSLKSQLRERAKINSVQGRARLLDGDLDGAFRDFHGATYGWLAEKPTEAWPTRLEHFELLSNQVLLHGERAIEVALKFGKRTQRILDPGTKEWIAISNGLAALLLVEGKIVGGDSGSNRVRESLDMLLDNAPILASGQLTDDLAQERMLAMANAVRAAMPSEPSSDLSITDIAKFKEALDTCIRLYGVLLEKQIDQKNDLTQWNEVMLGLGASYLSAANLSTPVEASSLVLKAVEVFSDLTKKNASGGESGVWAAAHVGIGSAWLRMAKATVENGGLGDVGTSLLPVAIQSFQAALTVFSEEKHPLAVAEIKVKESEALIWRASQGGGVNNGDYQTAIDLLKNAQHLLTNVSAPGIKRRIGDLLVHAQSDFR